MRITIGNITRLAVYFMGMAVAVVCGILLPELAREEAVGKVNPPSSLPYLIGAWGLTIPIFGALLETLKLLKLIDENQAFSEKSIKSLSKIKYYTIAFGVLITLGAASVIILARMANPTEDVVPIVSLGLIFVFVAGVIASFVAILEKLVKKAVDIKLENDLTV